jgi:hypothetical protein
MKTTGGGGCNGFFVAKTLTIAGSKVSAKRKSGMASQPSRPNFPKPLPTLSEAPSR